MSSQTMVVSMCASSVLLIMHCGGGEETVIECSPVAGASHSSPAKRTLLAWSGPGWSSQTTNQTPLRELSQPESSEHCI